MKSLFSFLSALALISCYDSTLKTQAHKVTTLKRSDSASLITDPVKSKSLEFLDDSVSIFRYGLKDTITEDINSDGFVDKLYFAQKSSARQIIFLDGRIKREMAFGVDLTVKGELGADYSWVDFWGITNDPTTWETVVKEGEVFGNRLVALKCPSIVLRKEEAGGGIITFKPDRFLWVHQAD